MTVNSENAKSFPFEQVLFLDPFIFKLLVCKINLVCDLKQLPVPVSSPCNGVLEYHPLLQSPYGVVCALKNEKV